MRRNETGSKIPREIRPKTTTPPKRHAQTDNRILYRDDYFRPIADEEFRYDIKRDRRFVLRTLEIEVIEATHNSIVFRVWHPGPGF